MYNTIAINSIEFKNKITAGLTISKLFINRLGEILTYQEFYHPKYLVQYIFYITPVGLCLNSFQYNSKLYFGVINFIIYIKSNGVCLNYFQYSSKLYKGIKCYTIYITPTGIALDYEQFNTMYNYRIKQTVLYYKVYVLNNSKNVLKDGKKLIKHIENMLDTYKENERKRKRNFRDRERRRILKEEQPELYLEKKLLRNAKRKNKQN